MRDVFGYRRVKQSDNIIGKIYRTILPFSFRKRVYSKLHYGLDKLKYGLNIAKGTLNIPVKEKRNKIGFEIQLVEHCNLNCKGCAHFSCIAEPEFLSVEEFERDANRLGDLAGHECDTICLMGGEPLLHPDIIKFMRIARENFKVGLIEVLTNGILLPNMSDEFWETCRDYKIYVRISHYPITLNVDKIKENADKFGVKCFWDIIDEKQKFFIYAIDLEGKENIANNFAICSQSINCATLKHGRLYPCPFAAHVHHFNKKFDKNILVTEKDYIDIYDAKLNKEKLLNNLAKPIQVCRFCKLTNLHTTEWEISKQDISEWL